MIQEALALASDRVAAAVARLGPAAEADPQVAAALAQYLRLDPAAAPESRRAAIQRRVDVLRTARNSMLTARADQFYCDDGTETRCATKKEVAAHVSTSVRGGTVTICEIFFGSSLPLRLGNETQVQAPAFTLFHEFVHLAGITARDTKLPVADDEMYHHQPEWPKLTPEQAATLADAYAALAWVLGGAPAGG
jgi:hypothetical protein